MAFLCLAKGGSALLIGAATVAASRDLLARRWQPLATPEGGGGQTAGSHLGPPFSLDRHTRD